MKHRYIMRATVINALFAVSACSKLIEVQAPVTSTSNENVYNTDLTAISVLTGIYIQLGTNGGSFVTGSRSISLFAGLSADEFDLYSGVNNSKLLAYYRNSLNVNSSDAGAEYWRDLYSYIFICNSAIEGINQSGSLTPNVKAQLTGEAKFLRAFLYFYLINLYGDVPLATTVDYQHNSWIGRSNKEDVYAQIIEDLKEAFTLLSDKYLDGELHEYLAMADRVRPTKWAAKALLARVYTYVSDYGNAEAAATEVINQPLYNLVDLNGVFLANSREAIWQLQPVIFGRNTEDALIFIIPESGPSDLFGSNGNPVYLSKNLLTAFEKMDIRKTSWVNSRAIGTDTFYFPYKYKVAKQDEPVTEYLTVLRLSEQFLIRAEARVKQNNISGALEDLNAVRRRAGISDAESGSSEELLQLILRERRVELFSEWGHRWLDLKRTGTIDSVMNEVTPLKGGNWNSSWQLYPVPVEDIQKNRNLTQNPGY